MRRRDVVGPCDWVVARCQFRVTGGSFCNEINASADPLAAEEIVATARTAVPGQQQTLAESKTRGSVPVML